MNCIKIVFHKQNEMLADQWMHQGVLVVKANVCKFMLLMRKCVVKFHADGQRTLATSMVCVYYNMHSIPYSRKLWRGF